MADLREVLRGQVREQMRGRRPFRRPVSVEIDLHATGMAQPPASPPSVKAYLDLRGKRGEPPLVYADDECVHYLRVRRHANDHPIARAEPEDWIYMDRPRRPWAPDLGVEVVITVRPLRAYIVDYDRLFRRREQVFGEDRRVSVARRRRSRRSRLLETGLGRSARRRQTARPALRRC
jgi:hypothetical protein